MRERERERERRERERRKQIEEEIGIDHSLFHFVLDLMELLFDAVLLLVLQVARPHHL